MPKIDDKDDRFGLPKASQNDSQIGPKNEQKSMPKTKRKKNQHKTKITPSETQKALKNQKKINNNQQITYTHVDPIWAPKTPPNPTPKRPQNDQKINTKKEPKQERKKKPTWTQNGSKMAPQNDPKTIKKQHAKTKKKKEAQVKKISRGAQEGFFARNRSPPHSPPLSSASRNEAQLSAALRKLRAAFRHLQGGGWGQGIPVWNLPSPVHTDVAHGSFSS